MLLCLSCFKSWDYRHVAPTALLSIEFMYYYKHIAPTELLDFDGMIDLNLFICIIFFKQYSPKLSDCRTIR